MQKDYNYENKKQQFELLYKNTLTWKIGSFFVVPATIIIEFCKNPITFCKEFRDRLETIFFNHFPNGFRLGNKFAFHKNQSQADCISYSKKEYYHLLEKIKALCLQHPEKPCIVYSTGTKQIGAENRANHPMQYAREFLKKRIPSVYVYYRFNLQEKSAAPLNEYVVQLPNDIFHEIYSDLASWNIPNEKLFLVSIPDAYAVQEIGLFKLFGWRIIYEVRDDWEEFHGHGKANWYYHSYERFLCQQADLITAVSKPLAEKMMIFGACPQRTFVIPNATSEKFIQIASKNNMFG